MGPYLKGLQPFIRREFSTIQSLSPVQLFVTPWTAAHQASLSISDSESSLKLMSIKSVMPSSHLNLCHPLLLRLSILTSIRVTSNESAVHISGQSTGASASFLPKSIQGWFPLWLTGLISLLFKGLSRVFFSTTIWKHQFFSTLPYLLSSSHIRTWLLERS